MVGIVLVSHSAQVAEGAVELAREMAGPGASIVAAGGLDLPGRPLGTDAALVAQAVDRAWSDDGVLVLMDLGSAVMSAEMALELIPAERRSKVLLCDAPVVEGAVAAAVAARLGQPLAQVAAEARGGLAGKIAHLAASPGQPADQEPAEPAGGAPSPDADGTLEMRISVSNRLGLHARPAARFVQTVGQFDATVTAENLTVPAGPASARSLNGVATLGVRQGHEILVRAARPAGGGGTQRRAPPRRPELRRARNRPAARGVASSPRAAGRHVRRAAGGRAPGRRHHAARARRLPRHRDSRRKAPSPGAG